jgi:hypothetical protein
MKTAWDGCSPLMLASSANDVYGAHANHFDIDTAMFYFTCCCSLLAAGIKLMVEHVRATQGDAGLAAILNEVQIGKQNSTALHFAADAAADGVIELLLELGANPVRTPFAALHVHGVVAP